MLPREHISSIRPRYMYLIELIPTDTTRPDLVEFISGFAEHTLGKGVVCCKDTPNFIANRIGIFSVMHAIHLMLKEGYTIDEVDAITGPPMGAPSQCDLPLGRHHWSRRSRGRWQTTSTKMRLTMNGAKFFGCPILSYRWLKRVGLVRKLGAASIRDAAAKTAAKSGHWTTIRLNTHLVRRYGSIRSMRSDESLIQGERLKRLIGSDDRAGQFAWKCLSHTMCYAASRMPEIADDLESIDNVMKWGFNWELGIFEAWDAIGVPGICRTDEIRKPCDSTLRCKSAEFRADLILQNIVQK